MRNFLRALAFGVLISNLVAQPAPVDSEVQLVFTPPDLPGRFVLGVFNEDGELVRRLVTDRDASVFDVGLNGYITSWDGLDDSGRRCPAGTYAARGFVIGDELVIQGEAFHFNDWIDEAGDAEVTRVMGVEPVDPANLIALFETSQGPVLERVPMVEGAGSWAVPVPGATALAGISGSTARVTTEAGERAYSLDDGTAVGSVTEPTSTEVEPVVDGGRVLDWAPSGEGNTRWAVVEVGGETAVAQLGEAGEILRTLPPDASGFVPETISAAPATEAIAVVESRGSEQRVRVLALDSTKESEVVDGRPVSDWQVLLERVITPIGNFGVVDGELNADVKASGQPDGVVIALDPTDLDPEGQTLRLVAGFDGGGSFLATESGLELLRVSERTGLRGVNLIEGEEPGTVRFFQGNGSVVEEFLILNVGRIAAFDCGNFRLTGGEE